MKTAKNVKKTNNKKGSTMKHYHIFRVEPVNEFRVKRITMTKFTAADDAEAYEHLKDYKKIANKEYTYYFEELGKYISKDKDGKEHRFNDFYEMMDDYHAHHNGLWHSLNHVFHRFWMRLGDCKFRIKDIYSYYKNQHGLGEDWDLFRHMLDDFEYNLPKIIDDISVPAYFEVLSYKKLHGDKTDTKVFFSESRKIFEGNEPEYKLAKEMWVSELEKFLEDIRLYNYYRDYGVIDTRKKEYVEIEKKYEKTLPYLPGRYKVFDYGKLTILKNKHKNRIIEFIRKFGEELSD